MCLGHNPPGQKVLTVKAAPQSCPCFFSMLFLLKPISLWLWFNSYYSMWTGDWGARAKLFTIHFCHSSAFINRPGNAAKDHHSRCIPDETRWWLCGEDFCSETNPLRLRKKKTNSLAEVWWVRRAQFICHIVPVCSSTFPPTLTGSQHTRSLTVTWSTHMVPLNLPEHCDLPCPAMRITTGTWSSSSSSPPSPPDIPLLSHNPTTQARQPNTHPPREASTKRCPSTFRRSSRVWWRGCWRWTRSSAWLCRRRWRKTSLGEKRVGFLGENGMRL